MRFSSIPEKIIPLCISIALVGCGGGSSSDNDSPTAPVSETVEATNYNGPGSKWDVTLNSDDTFVITRRESLNDPIDLTVEGTYEDLDSGFLLLTVSSGSGENVPPAGSQALALEAPGYALFLKPLGSGDNQILAMVTAGECPSSDIAANWVLVKSASDANANQSDRDFLASSILM